MQRILINQTLPFWLTASLMLCVTTMSGCVGMDTHTKTLAELDAEKKSSAQLQQQLADLQGNLDQEAAQRRAAEQQANALIQEREALQTRSNELQSRLDGLENEKRQLNGELGNVRNHITDLEQKLASGNTTAQAEIAALQKKASGLEANAARIAQEREQLRQEQLQLATMLEQERLAKETNAAHSAQEREQLRREQLQLAAMLEQERLAKEAKEEEINRLTRTHDDLSKSLQDEISKGNITIQQVRDRLTINMVERVLFDSGQAQVKPTGIKVLKEVGDILKNITDKQIRIEGHTDNVPISLKLQNRFKTNWELSTARATTVVRYLIEQSGVDRQYLSAVGYADTRPIALNDSEEGRSSNRRIEIVLYPKDLNEITNQVQVETGATTLR
ncbi:MAG: OmpA family protein [Candidatus Nitrotoga sp.]